MMLGSCDVREVWHSRQQHLPPKTNSRALWHKRFLEASNGINDSEGGPLHQLTVVWTPLVSTHTHTQTL